MPDENITSLGLSEPTSEGRCLRGSQLNLVGSQVTGAHAEIQV